MVEDKRPRVVIIGGGFGGLTAAKALARSPVSVTLIDRRNHHLFQPLLYQVATAGLSPANIAAPIRGVLARQENASVLLADVLSIDVNKREVRLTPLSPDHAPAPPLTYDTLIVASGAKSAYFGHDAWAKNAIGLKSLEDALEVRRRVLMAFERAEREEDAAARRALTTFVVIGGGATGVEMAGALGELSRNVLARDFRAIDPSQSRVVLVEAGPEILTNFAPALSESGRAQLEELGVEVHRNARVIEIDARGVTLKEGGADVRIDAATTLWGAGVAATAITSTLGVPLDKQHRVLVQPDCSVPGHPEVFVIGDAAAYAHGDGTFLPGVSPVAMQQARFVATIVTDEAKGIRPSTERPKFKYFDKGSMATIGRSRAIAEVRGIHMRGAIAWLAWLFVHLWYLIGFRNRIIVMFEWGWSYVTYRRGARLITSEVRGDESDARRTAPAQSS